MHTLFISEIIRIYTYINARSNTTNRYTANIWKISPISIKHDFTHIPSNIPNDH